MVQKSFHSPVGELTLSEEGGRIVALDWGRGAVQGTHPVLDEAIGQLQAYFDGNRRDFDLPLAPQGSEKIARLWTALAGVPWGVTVSYGELARAAGSSARAAGQACARNPLPILIPCHRVVKADGSLGQYSGDGGVDTKRALLRLEGVNI